MLCNRLPSNPDFEAVLNRSFFYYFNPSNSELVEVILSNNKPDLEVLEFIKREFGEHKPFNFRDYQKFVKFHDEYGNNYADYVIPLLYSDDKYALIRDLLNSRLSIGEQIKEYIEKSGKTERSYYRDKAKVLNE